MKIQRRTLLRAGVAAAAIAPLPFLFRQRSAGASTLKPDPNGILDLAAGLSYRVIERVFDPMSDGHRVPARPDGMAAFAGPTGTIVLMRNHELDRARALAPYRSGSPPPEAYDQRTVGGVTRLVVDATSLHRISSNLVLTGTLRNCAGGPSPWGWLSCEEATDSGHGYVFACAIEADRVQPAKRIIEYGRFKHEAVCIDLRTHVAYLTEDQGDGCLYRFVPTAFSRPFVGKLQAMRVIGKPNFDTSNMTAGQSVDVDWIDIGDPNPSDDTVRSQAHERGAALIRRGEGAFFHDGAAYVCSTSGGPVEGGQIFKLLVGTNRPDRLLLLAQSTDSERLDHPDNITVAPWGDVMMAEDGGGDQYLRGITPEGRSYDIARNAASSGELAGVCLSPDGRHVFLNMQADGLTVVITGDLAALGRT